MSFKYFRFYLSESAGYDAEVLERYQSVLSSCNDLGFIRASFDLISPDKSMSILCESEGDIEKEIEKWRAALKKHNINFQKNILHEVLQDEEQIKISCMHDKNCTHDHDHHDHHDHHDNHWLKASVGLVYGIGLLILSIAGLDIPMIAYYIMTGCSTLVTLYLGHKVYQSAWHALTQKKWDMSMLYTISSLAIVGIAIVSIFVPGLPMVLESAPLILGFWHLGEAIEHGLLDKINIKLDIRDCASKTALLKEGGVREILVNQLIPNDRIIIKAGEVIPVDGVVTESTLLYTTRVDGSPYPKQFNAGDAVKAGMSLASHLQPMEMQVTKSHQHSYLSLIAKNINKANKEKAPVEDFANKILKYFVPGLLAVALVSGVVVGIVFTPALAIQCVISVLVSACPCVLSIITPKAIEIGMKKASEQGVHYKDGKTLQTASDIDTVAFDLNGTLTEGEVTVDAIKMDVKNREFLKYFALLESKSAHPVAEKIKRYIENQGVVIDEILATTAVHTSQYASHHSGIAGTIAGETFMIGNRDMLRANGVLHINSPYEDVKNGSIYMVRGEEVVGQIALTDPLRKDAVATVKQLQLMGKAVHICTGADRVTAEGYARLLGIPSNNICANAVGAAPAINNETHFQPGHAERCNESPDNNIALNPPLPNQRLSGMTNQVGTDKTSKLGYIQWLQCNGRKVAMVGDAANDLAAIAKSDIGIAVKSSIGDTLMEQHAGMVLQQGLLFPIATAFDVASKTKQNIFQNLFVSLTYNSVITLVAAGLFLALGLSLNPVVGVALMALESAIVLANIYRLKHQYIILPVTNIGRKSETLDPEETTSKVLKELGLSRGVALEQNALSEKERLSDADRSMSYKHQSQFFGGNNNNTAHNQLTSSMDEALVLAS